MLKKLSNAEKVLHLFANPLSFIYLCHSINKFKPKNKAMKKYFLFLIVALISTIAFTSCSDDNDDKINSPVVGTWESGDDLLDIYTLLTFKDNGAVVGTDYYGDGTYYTDRGTYNVSKNTITINWIGYEEEDDETVIMRFEMSDDNNIMTTEMLGESGSTRWRRVR